MPRVLPPPTRSRARCAYAVRHDLEVADAKPQRFSLIVFYRGLHCPICTTYVADLKWVPEFTTRGWRR